MHLAITCAVSALGLALGAPAPATSVAPPSVFVAQDHDAELSKLNDEFDAAQKEFSTAYRARSTEIGRDAGEDERAALREWYDANQPGPRFAPRFEALADAAKGSDTAVRAWSRVLELGDGAAKTRALKALVAGPDSTELASIASQVQNARDLPREDVYALLSKMRASAHRSVVAPGTYSLGKMLMAETGEREKAKGRGMMEMLARDFSDVKTRRGKAWSEIAAADLYEIDHLQIGMVAPEFESIDETGAAFKLSDYRGKVTVLDFWGFW